MNPSYPKAGSWTSKSVELRALPSALDSLATALGSRLKRMELDEERRAELVVLERRLTAMRGQRPDGALFEEIVRVCYTYGHHRTESFLAFMYTALRQPLASFSMNLLRRMGSREDVEALSLDLVGTLFTELAEAYMEDEDDSSRIPPAGHILPWLFQALRHDAMDHCKSATNRKEQSVEPVLDESFEQALHRLAYPLMPEVLDGGWSQIDAGERREAFIIAFHEATAALKPHHREVLRLRELDGANIEEIAEQLDLPRQKVLDLLQYGREKRAQLLASRLRAFPALADLHHRSEEMAALLQKVKLWCFTERLRPAGPPGGETGRRPLTRKPPGL